MSEKYIPRMKTAYRQEVVPELVKEFNYTSVMQVPRLVKINVSMGMGDAIQNKKLLESALKELAHAVL